MEIKISNVEYKYKFLGKKVNRLVNFGITREFINLHSSH